MNARCNHVSEKPESCRGENSNLAEFAQMRQKRMGIGAIKTSFGGIGPMCQKGTFVADSPDSGLVYPHKVGLPSHICNGNWVCAILDEEGCRIIGMLSPERRHR